MSDAPAKSGETFLKAYDQYGRELQIDREEWRNKILPTLVKKEWEDAGALFSTVTMALGQGFVEESLEGAERLLVIDADRERSHALLAHIRMRLGHLEEARTLLEDYLKTHGRSALVLIRYAHVLAQGGDQKKALENIWEALKEDPNQKEALEWWGAIHKRRGGDKEFLRSMEAMALKGSLRARLHLARHALIARGFGEARAHFEEALKEGGTRADLLAEASGVLSAAGLHGELIELISPIYDARKHGTEVGLNLLEAYLKKGRKPDGRVFLKKMFLLDRPDLEEKLLEYSDAFESPSGKKKKAARGKAGRFVAHPVWYSALKKPSWLIPEADGPRILLSVPRLKAAARDSEADMWCRAIPHYFLETLMFRCRARLSAEVGAPGKELDAPGIKRLAKACPGGCDYIITGVLDDAQGPWSLRLEVWDAVKAIKTGIRISPGQDLIGRELAEAVSWIIGQFSEVPGFGAHEDVGPFAGHAAELGDRDLACLTRVMELSSVRGRTAKNRPKGERHIFNGMIDLCARSGGAQGPKVMLLASFAAAKAFGSEVLDEFKGKAATLIEEEGDQQSPFYKLTPLLYQIFSMLEEGDHRSRSLKQRATPEYLSWLKSLD